MSRECCGCGAMILNEGVEVLAEFSEFSELSEEAILKSYWFVFVEANQIEAVKPQQKETV